MKFSLRARWLGKPQGTILEKRKTGGRWLRPWLEPLEERLAPAQFALLDGVLYNTTDSPPQQIDTEVVSYSVVNNQVIDLHIDGDLDSLQSDGSQRTVFDVNVRSFAFTAQGQLLVLDQNNSLSNWGTVSSSAPPSLQFQMDTGATSVAITPQGTVLELNQDGDLKEWLAAAQNWLVLRSQVQSFAVDGSGDAIMLSADGALYDQYNPSVPGDVVELGSAVESFAIAGNGAVVWLDTAGNLYHQYDAAVAGAASQLAGAVQSFAVAGNGDMIWLNTAGSLFDQFNLQAPGDATQIAGAVRSFAIAGSGDVIWLDTGGNLFDQADPQAVGAFSQIGSNIQSFAIAGDADGDVIMLDHSGNLTDQPASGGASVAIGTGIQAFVIGGNGDVITLAAGGAVNDLPIPSVAGDFTAINPDPVAAIAVAGNGDLIMLDAQGTVYDQYNPRLAGKYTAIATGISSIALAPNGDVTMVNATGVASLYDLSTGIVTAPVIEQDGLLVQDATTGAVSIVDGGEARPVSPAVYQYLGNPPATSITHSQYMSIPTGSAYYPEQMIVEDATTGVLSIIDGGLACPLSAAVYQYLGNPQVTSIPDAAYTAIPTGPAYYPNGMIVQDAATNALSIDGGQARPLSAAVYLYLGNPPVISIPDAAYAAIPTGPAYYPNGMIVQDAVTNALSIIDGGQARPLSAPVYLYLGNPPVTSIPDTDYTAIAAGPSYYPEGMIVEDATTNALSIVEGGQARPLRAAVYQYLGNPPATIISDAQYTAIPIGLAYYPDGMVVQDAVTNALSIIEGRQTRPLSNQVYLYLGQPPVTSISDAQYTAIPAGLAYYPDGMIVQDTLTNAMSIIHGGDQRPLSAEAYQYLGEPPLTTISDAEYSAIPSCVYYYANNAVVQTPRVEFVSIVDGPQNRGNSPSGYATLGNPQGTLNSYAQDPAVSTSLSYFPDGMIVQDGTSTGAMSIIQVGLKRLVSAAVYQYLGDPPVTVITDGEYQAIPTGLQYFPSGMIVQDGTSSGAMSLVQGGLKRLVSAAVYQYLGDPPITVITDAEYQAIPTGLQCFPSGMIVQDGTTSGAMSIIQGGLKRLVSAADYQYLGDPPVTVITDAEYQAIPTALQYFPDGMIVQDGSSTGAMSIIQGGLKELVSAEVYQYLGGPPVSVISDAEYQAIPTGLQYFPTGMIVQDGNSGPMSIIQSGVKRLLSAEVYQYLGDPPVTAIADADYQAIPTGLQYFPTGMVVQDGSSSGAMSIIQGGLKEPVSAEVYQYLGDPPVTIISDAEYQSIPTGLPYFPTGMIVQDGSGNGAMSIIQGGLKALVSAEVYQYLGDPPVTVIADAEYQALPTGLQYFPTGMIVQDGNNGPLSVIQGGVKRLMNAEVYQFLGDPPITTISDSAYQAIPTGLPYFPDGMIVQDGTSAGAMSIIQRGLKELVSAEVYEYLGAPPVTVIVNSEYQAIPTGLEYFPDGMIVQDGSSSGAMSIIQGGVKRLVDAHVYQYLGNPAVTVISDAEYQAIPTGLQYFPDGIIVENVADGDVSIIQGGLKRPITEEVYQYLGFPQVTGTSAIEYVDIPTGLPYFPNGMIVQDGDSSGAMSIIQGGLKMLVSAEVYQYLGDPPLTIISDTDYQAIPTGLEYFPGGMIVQDGDSNGAMSIIQRGFKELVSPEVYQFLGDPPITIISAAEYQGIPTNLQYFPGGMIVQDGSSSGPISIIQGGVKRLLSEEVYIYLGSPRATVIPDADYQAIATGLEYFPNGMIVQDGSSSGPLSIIEGGFKQLVSAAVYVYLGDPQVIVIPDADYQTIPTGLQYFPDGMLAQNSSGTIDIIEGGAKHYLSYDVSAYLASLYGYTNDPPAVTIPDDQFNAIPSGLPYFPDGMIVQDGSSTGAISIIENGEKCLLDSSIYQALGEPLIFDIPDAQYAAIPVGLPYFPEGTLVQDGSDTGPISMIRGGEKWLVSAEVYQYLGDPATVIIADTAYQAIPTGLQYFPEGMVVQDTITGITAIIQDGKKHEPGLEVLAFQAVLGYLGNPAPTPISDAQFNAIPTGLAYFPDGMIVQDEKTGAEAIIEGGVKHALSSEVLGYLGNPAATPILDLDFRAIPTGSAYYPTGMIVQDDSTGMPDSGQISIIENGLRRPLSPTVLAYLGNPTPTPIPDSEYAGIPAGLAYFPAGMFITDGSNVAIFEGGEKHLLSQAVENYLGLSSTSPAVIYDAADYPSIPVGLPYYPDGMLVEDLSTGAISIIQRSQKRLVSSGIYQYLGDPPVKRISDTEYLGIPVGLPYVPEGLFVSDAISGAVDIILNGQKHLVSPQVETYLALQAQQIKTIPTAEFNAIPLGLQYYPEGMFVSAAGEPICIIRNGEKCFVSSDVYQWLGGPAYTNLSDDQFNAIPTGPQYFPNGMILAAGTVNEVPIDLCIVEGGVKYYITQDVYHYLGSPTITYDSSEIQALRVGEGGTTSYYPDGMIVADSSTGEFSIIEGGMKHLLSFAAADHLGVFENEAQHVSNISDSEYTSIPTGLPYYPDGMYLTNASTGQTSIIENGQRHLLSPALAADLSADNPNFTPVDITSDQYNAIPPSESTFYVMNAGNLYCVRANGDAIQIGSSVLSFAIAGNGDVVYLTSDGDLYDQWNPCVSGDSTRIGSGMASFAIAGNGDVISFDASSGTVYDLRNIRVPGDATLLSGNVTSYAIAGDGNVVMLISSVSGGSELVEQWNTRLFGDSRVIAGDVTSFGVAGNGDVIAFDAATQTLIDEWNPPTGAAIMSDAVGNSTVLGRDVLSFAVAGNGDVVKLSTSNDVFDIWNPRVAADATEIASSIASIAVAGNGDVIMFNQAFGTIYDQWNPRENGDATATFTGDARSFAVAGDGDVIILTTDNLLYDQWNTRLGAETLLANNVSSFVIAGNGSVVFVTLVATQVSGTLGLTTQTVYLFAEAEFNDGVTTDIIPAGIYPGSATPQICVAANGDVIVLLPDGNVVDQHDPLANVPWAQMLSGVDAIATAANGDVIMFQSGPAKLYDQSNPRDTGTLTLMATNVIQFAIGASGDVLFTGSGPNLYDQWNPRILGDANVVDLGVTMFAPDGHGGVYVLRDHNLYDGPLQSTPKQTEQRQTNIDIDVQEFAPDGIGGLYVLHTNNGLWDVTYTGLPWQLVGMFQQEPAYASETHISDNIEDFYFLGTGQFETDPTPSGVFNFLDNLTKDLLSFTIAATVFTIGEQFGGPLSGFEAAKWVGNKVPQSHWGQEIWENQNQYWHDAFAGGVVVASVVITTLTFGELAPEAGAVDAGILTAGEATAQTVAAGAASATAGAAFNSTANAAYDYATTGHLSYDWQSVAEAPFLGAISAGVGSAVGGALAGTEPSVAPPSGFSFSTPTPASFLSGAASNFVTSFAGAGFNALFNHTSFDWGSAIGGTIEGTAIAATGVSYNPGQTGPDSTVAISPGTGYPSLLAGNYDVYQNADQGWPGSSPTSGSGNNYSLLPNLAQQFSSFGLAWGAFWDAAAQYEVQRQNALDLATPQTYSVTVPSAESLSQQVEQMNQNVAGATKVYPVSSLYNANSLLNQSTETQQTSVPRSASEMFAAAFPTLAPLVSPQAVSGLAMMTEGLMNVAGSAVEPPGVDVLIAFQGAYEATAGLQQFWKAVFGVDPLPFFNSPTAGIFGDAGAALDTSYANPGPLFELIGRAFDYFPTSSMLPGPAPGFATEFLENGFSIASDYRDILNAISQRAPGTGSSIALAAPSPEWAKAYEYELPTSVASPGPVMQVGGAPFNPLATPPLGEPGPLPLASASPTGVFEPNYRNGSNYINSIFAPVFWNQSITSSPTSTIPFINSFNNQAQQSVLNSPVYARISSPAVDTPPTLPIPVPLPAPADPVTSPLPIPVHSFYAFSSIEPSFFSVWNNGSVITQMPYSAAVAIGTASSGGVELIFNNRTIDFPPGQVTTIGLTLNGYSNAVALRSLPAGVTVIITGTGSNTLSAPTGTANTWDITGLNSGILDGVVTFSGVQFLQGGGNDVFDFQTGGSVSGNVDEPGNAVLDYSQDTNPVSVNVQTGQATNIGGFFNNVSTFVGNPNVNDSFTGTDDNGTWTLVDASQFQTSSQTFTFSGFQTIQGGTGTDTFNVEGTPTTGLIIYTGTGNDNVNITPTSQNLANIAGPLTIIGQGGADPLVVSDQADTAAGLTYNIGSGSIQASTSAAIVYGNMVSFLLYAGGSSAGAVANINSVSQYTPMAIDAAAGAPLTVNISPIDQWLGEVTGPLTLNGAAAVNLDDQADTISGTSTITATTVSVPDAVPITYSGTPVLTLNGGDSDNFYDLVSTAGPTIINTGRGDDAINVGSTANTLDPLTGSVTVNGQGADQLTIDDLGTTANESYTIDASRMTSRTGAVSIGYAGVFLLTVNGGQGNNTYDIVGTPSATTLNTGSGDDIINVGQMLDALHGPLTVNGQGGPDLLNVSDLGTTTAQTFIITSTTVTSRSGAVLITFAAMVQATVSGGSGGNVFDVENTAVGTPVIVNTGGGGDTVNVSPTDELLSDMAAPLTVNGRGAGDTLNLDDQNDQAYAYNVNDAFVYTVTNIAVESSVSAPVYYTQIGALNLHTSSGSTNGGYIPALADETLNIESTAAGTQLTVDALSGELPWGNVNISPVANDLRNIAGSVFLDFGYIVNFTFDDQSDPAAGTYIITDTGPEIGNDPNWFASIMRVGAAAVSWNGGVENPLTVNGGTGANTYDIQAVGGDVGNTLLALTLNTGPGSDTINVGNAEHDFSSNPFIFPVTINGQGGTDQLNFNDQNDSSSGGVSYGLASVADAVVPYEFLTMPIVIVDESSFYYTGMAGVTVSGATAPSEGFSQYGVDSTDAGTPVTLNLGSTNDLVWLGSATQGLAAIAGNVTVNGQGGSDQLTVYDGAGTQDGTYTITSSTIQRAGSAIITYTQVPDLEIDGGVGGTGSPTYNIESTAAGTTLNLNTEIPEETINFSPTAENLATIAGEVSVIGQGEGGPITVNIDDQNNTLNSTYTLNADGMSRPGAAAINLNGAAASIVLNGGSGSNTYDIPLAGFIQAMTVNTGSGNDTIDLSDDVTPITIIGQGGNDTLNFTGGLPDTVTSSDLGSYVTYGGIATINIDASETSGFGDVEVASTAAGTVVNIAPSPGYASVNIGNSDPNLGIVQGTVVVNEQGDLFVSNLSAAGNVQLSCTGTLSVDGIITDSDGYTLSAVGGIVVYSGGTVSGGGTINGDVTNGGEIEVGQGGAGLTVNGNYSQTWAGSLVVDLLSTSTYGQLSVSGAASLDGTLTAQTDNGFTVAAGDQFTALTYGSVIGDFATKNLSLAGGRQLYTSFAAQALTLITTATPTITWNTPAAIVYGTALSSTQLDATASVPGTFTYTPAAGTVLEAGASQALDVTFIPTDSVSYRTVSSQVFVTVKAAKLTITPTAGQSMDYGATVPALTYVASPFVNGDTASLLTGMLGTTATSSSPVGNYAFTLGSLRAGDNYTLVLAAKPATFAVVPAALTIAPTPGQSMIYGSPVPTLSYVASGFVNGDTASLLTGVLATTATSSSPVGNYAFTLGSLGAGGNYALVLTANAPAFAVTYRQLAVTGITATNKVYDGTTAATLSGLSAAALTGVLPGDDVTLSTTGASGEFASRNVGAGVIVTVSGLTLGGAQAANYTVTATTTANITPAFLTVSVVANTKVYDGTTSAAALPTITSGKLLGADTAEFSEAYVTKNVGTGLTLTPEGMVNDGNGGHNYTVTFRSAALGKITARPITVTATTNNKTYDGTTAAAAIPTITSGVLAAGDTAGFHESYATKNTGSKLKLTPSGSVKDGNKGRDYAVTYRVVVTGKITRRPLTVTAQDASKVYGHANPGLKATFSGFAPGDPSSVLKGVASLSTTAKTVSGVGTYSITVTAGSLSAVNYSFVFVSGTLSVTPATLTVTAESVSRPYGTANPTLTWTIAGFVKGDTMSVVHGNPALSTGATTSSGVGTYAITATSGSLTAANYTFRFVSGNLTVTKATLTIAANKVSWVIGQPEPALTFIISGLVDGDTITPPVLSTTATSTSPAGRYKISLKEVDGIKVKSLSPTRKSGVSAVTLSSEDAVLRNYRVLFVSALETRLR